MLRSATVLALLGTAAAAGTYPTKAESCSAFTSMLTCEMLEDKDACNANTDCLWEVEEEYPDEAMCTVGKALRMQMDYSAMNASAALINQTLACYKITDEADCSGSCGWGEDPHAEESKAMCMVSRAKAQAILIEDGAPPFVRAMNYYESSDAVTCYGLDEETCATTAGCMFEEDDEDCVASEMSAMLMVNNKCDGSASSLILEYVNAMQEDGAEEITDIDDVYAYFNVPAEYSAAKLADQAEAVAKVAKEKTEAAETAKAAIPTDNLAEADKAKLDFLAAAAINGQTVKKVVATLDADDADTACASTFEKMGLTSDDGACTATAARRRKLLASYSAEVLLDPAKVDETAAAAAVATIEADTTVTTTVTDENPVDEIEAIPNIDATAVATFKTSAAEAADANIEAQAYEAEEAEAEISAASSVAAVSAIATAALAAAACVFA